MVSFNFLMDVNFLEIAGCHLIFWKNEKLLTFKQQLAMKLKSYWITRLKLPFLFRLYKFDTCDIICLKLNHLIWFQWKEKSMGSWWHVLAYVCVYVCLWWIQFINTIYWRQTPVLLILCIDMSCMERKNWLFSVKVSHLGLSVVKLWNL